jgi:hypothetical protein
LPSKALTGGFAEGRMYERALILWIREPAARSKRAPIRAAWPSAALGAALRGGWGACGKPAKKLSSSRLNESYRVESIFHWYLEQRKNDRSGCLADFVVVLTRLEVGVKPQAPGNWWRAARSSAPARKVDDVIFRRWCRESQAIITAQSAHSSVTRRWRSSKLPGAGA